MTFNENTENIGLKVSEVKLSAETTKIGIVGLGYVGLPLGIEISRKYSAIGYDVNETRIKELNQHIDRTLEVPLHDLENTNLRFTSDVQALTECNIYIITVPTPVDKNKHPDFQPLRQASEMVGGVLKRDDIVIYESTVYPGATEEICVPILELKSGLKFKQDFHVGYSPERINPGDKNKTIRDIIKVTSGSDAQTATIVDQLYGSIIPAGTHLAPSIKVAEAAKVIENIQRDINIGLMNELSKIFHLLDLDTTSVLRAAGTKWNFLPFKPGLVGGHCIGVDPYYLTFKAHQLGLHPEIITAARSINDNVSSFVVNEFIKALIKKKIVISGCKVLILGLTFKENCPDMRNSKVLDIIARLKEFDIDLTLSDPYYSNINKINGIVVSSLSEVITERFDGVILAVDHEEYVRLGSKGLKNIVSENGVLFDLKSVLNISDSDWRL